jgi:hypothetical protein
VVLLVALDSLDLVDQDSSDLFLMGVPAAHGSPGAAHGSPGAVIAELAIVTFFLFAMRSCKCATAPTPGRTKTIDSQGVSFCDSSEPAVLHVSPSLDDSEHVSLLCVHQKNKVKNDTPRSQQGTRDPVLSAFAVLSQILGKFPRSMPFSSRLTRGHLHCPRGTAMRGRTQADTKSLRSGAAMSLFLMNHSAERIVLLGQQRSDSFVPKCSSGLTT